MKNIDEIKIKITIGVLELVNSKNVDKESILNDINELASLYNIDKLKTLPGDYDINQALINLLKNEKPIKELLEKLLAAVKQFK